MELGFGSTMNWTAYKKPKNVGEALAFLEQADGKGRVIAGGTNLLLQLRRHELTVETLVDISEIQDLKAIWEKEDWIYIGAGVTHREVAKNPVIQREVRTLAQGCGQVGSPQIRNMGTLVGNVVNAHSAGDGAIPLMALEAELGVVSKEGERWIALEEAYRAIGLSAVDPTKDVATAVRFKNFRGYRKTGFFRMARRKALALPIVNGSVSVFWDGSRNRIEKARIAIGPVAYKPLRPRKAEHYLESMKISDENLLHGCRIASEEGSPRTTFQASALYRERMIEINLFLTIKGILDELRGTT